MVKEIEHIQCINPDEGGKRGNYSSPDSMLKKTHMPEGKTVSVTDPLHNQQRPLGGKSHTVNNGCN